VSSEPVTTRVGVLVVVELEVPEHGGIRDARSGATLAVLRAIRAAGTPGAGDTGLTLRARYLDGTPIPIRVHGVGELNEMMVNRAVETVVTDVLFRSSEDEPNDTVTS